MTRKPMKAPTEPLTPEDLKRLKYPVYGSPKLDGFRCVVENGIPLTSSLEPFKNRFLLSEFEKMSYYTEGLDGEIVVGNPDDPKVFNNTSGPVRREDGKPDFSFYAFDDRRYPSRPYHERWVENMYNREKYRIKILPQITLHCPEDVLLFAERCIKKGYEGSMIRSIDACYKFGRATFLEQIIFKIKPFNECEAKIVGFDEQMENTNEAKKDNLGRSKRSTHKAGLKGKNTLGALILKAKKWEKPFTCGTGKGIDNNLKKHIWDNRSEYLGDFVTISFQKYGSIEAPRIPTILKFRPKWDITKY